MELAEPFVVWMPWVGRGATGGSPVQMQQDSNHFIRKEFQ